MKKEKSKAKKNEDVKVDVQDKFDKNKRTKERTIADIIEKVSMWRKLYNGVTIPA